MFASYRTKEGNVVTTIPTVEVRVGSGSKAHLFRSRTDADAKASQLHAGGVVEDYVLCGASGALTLAEDLESCRTCVAVLDREP